MGDLTKLVYCRMQVSKLTMSVKKVLALFNGHSKPISFKSEGDEADLDALKKLWHLSISWRGKLSFSRLKMRNGKANLLTLWQVQSLTSL